MASFTGSITGSIGGTSTTCGSDQVGGVGGTSSGTNGTRGSDQDRVNVGARLCDGEGDGDGDGDDDSDEDTCTASNGGLAAAEPGEGFQGGGPSLATEGNLSFDPSIYPLRESFLRSGGLSPGTPLHLLHRLHRTHRAREKHEKEDGQEGEEGGGGRKEGETLLMRL